MAKGEKMKELDVSLGEFVKEIGITDNTFRARIKRMKELYEFDDTQIKKFGSKGKRSEFDLSYEWAPLLKVIVTTIEYNPCFRGNFEVKNKSLNDYLGYIKRLVEAIDKELPDHIAYIIKGRPEYTKAVVLLNLLPNMIDIFSRLFSAVDCIDETNLLNFFSTMYQTADNWLGNLYKSCRVLNEVELSNKAYIEKQSEEMLGRSDDESKESPAKLHGEEIPKENNKIKYLNLDAVLVEVLKETIKTTKKSTMADESIHDNILNFAEDYGKYFGLEVTDTSDNEVNDNHELIYSALLDAAYVGYDNIELIDKTVENCKNTLYKSKSYTNQVRSYIEKVEKLSKKELNKELDSILETKKKTLERKITGLEEEISYCKDQLSKLNINREKTNLPIQKVHAQNYIRFFDELEVNPYREYLEKFIGQALIAKMNKEYNK